MQQTCSKRYHYEMTPVVAEKLARCKTASEQLMKREIKCPVCGFYLLDVYGRDHHYTRVKCNNCKFNEVIDTALFRTVRVRTPRR